MINSTIFCIWLISKVGALSPVINEADELNQNQIHTVISTPLSTPLERAVMNQGSLYRVSVSVHIEGEDAPSLGADQDKSQDDFNRWGLTLNLGGPTLLGSVSLEVFASPSFNFEAGLGIFGVFIGAKKRLVTNDNPTLKPYLGIYSMLIPGIFGSDTTGLFIPVGVESELSKHWALALEVAGLITDKELLDTPVWGTFKLSLRL
jgi:hypothetical protein